MTFVDQCQKPQLIQHYLRFYSVLHDVGLNDQLQLPQFLLDYHSYDTIKLIKHWPRLNAETAY